MDAFPCFVSGTLKNEEPCYWIRNDLSSSIQRLSTNAVTRLNHVSLCMSQLILRPYTRATNLIILHVCFRMLFRCHVWRFHLPLFLEGKRNDFSLSTSCLLPYQPLFSLMAGNDGNKKRENGSMKWQNFCIHIFAVYPIQHRPLTCLTFGLPVNLCYKGFVKSMQIMAPFFVIMSYTPAM
jgi:hypothetical protein